MKIDRTLAVFSLAVITVLLLSVLLIPRVEVTGARAHAARNVIVFVGDGMGPATVTAARWYKAQNGMGSLAIDGMPYTAVVRTESIGSMVTDSAAAATALFSGHKTYSGMLNVNGNERYGTIVEEARNAGKATGIVTTSSVVTSTPAGCYARDPDRYDESGIARQLYDSGIDVIMGGGRDALTSTKTPGNGVDLIRAFKAKGYQYAYDDKSFRALGDGKILALFDPGSMKYEADRTGEPSLADMTARAITALSKDPDGYFLMVEGGNIDTASHETKAYKVVTDTAALDDAVARALGMVDLTDTLVIVASDHAHTLTIAGYPSADTPILGTTVLAGNGWRVEYPILNFGTGIRPYKASDWAGYRPDKDTLYPGASTIGTETHGGETVDAYAAGPGAEKLHGTMHLTGVYGLMHEAMA